MKNLLFIFLLISQATLYSQQYSQEFGVIAKDEFDLVTYDKDPEAEAVVLFDIGESYFEYTYEEGFNITFTRVRRIKILAEAGKDFADVEIPYYVDGYGRTERVKNIKATVYNITGSNSIERSFLEESAIYEEQINKYYRAKKFALPDVKVGSIIEYKYTLWTPFHFNLPDWEFQDRIPTIFSKYVVKLIPFYEYVYLLQGDPLDNQTKELDNGLERSVSGIRYRDMIFTFERNHTPAFKDESFITSRKDYISKLDFQLSKVHQLNGSQTEIMTTWPKMVKDYLDYPEFGKYLNQAEKIALKEIIPNLSLDGKSKMEQAQAIVQYVKSNYNWDHYYGKFARENAKSFQNKKEGNAAEINLFLTSCLNAAGISAYPMVLSTRDNGKISTNHPFSSFFNYTAVLMDIDGTLLIADGTEPLLSFEKIPPRCINEHGLIIQKDNPQWIDLNTSAEGSNIYNINLTPNPEQREINYMVNQVSSDLSAYSLKKRFKDNEEDLKSELEKNDYLHISKLLTRNFDENLKPYMLIHAGTAPLEQVANKLVIKPLLNLPMTENILKQEKRTYPVDFIYRQNEVYEATIMIPENYEAEYLPEKISFSNHLMEVTYSAEIMGNRIVVKASYKYLKAIYQPNEYQQLKNHLNTIVRKFNDAIVLRPVTP